MTIDKLLRFIARAENGGRIDYNVIYGGIKSADYPPKRLTELTVGEVLDWQDSIDAKYRSEAAGAFQILEDTLRGLYRQAGVPLTAKFDADTQNKLATALLRRRGLDDYLAGRISAEAFAQNLSKEWASLPCFTRDARGRPAEGQSYYAGDGLNRAHVSRDETLAVVRSVRAEPEPEPRTSPVQSKTLAAAGAQAATGVGAAAGGVAMLDGTAQLVAIAFAGLIVLLAIWIMRERLRKWAGGDR